MKKCVKFFCCGFFSHKWSKEGTRHGYSTFIISLILALIFLWIGYVCGDMLPFPVHYNNASDFTETVRSVFANHDINNRIDAEITDGVLKVARHGEEFCEGVLVNTFENETDKQKYYSNGYNVVIDTRPKDALAEVEAYCISNDGQDIIISYEEYLSLSTVARLNFDFYLRYTGNELILTNELIEKYISYIDGLNEETAEALADIVNQFEQSKISEDEYKRSIYELYFANYYPEITAYESSSRVPLLRNYYYHKYINQGENKYLFIFDDYMAGNFETDNGIKYSFYGFYSDIENGALITEGATIDEANDMADDFVKKSFASIVILSMYAYGLNIFSLIPFIALMPMVITLLAYSIIKLRGVESIKSLGAMFKIIGSYSWTSGLIAAILSVICSFFVPRNIISALPLVLFLLTLAARSIIFSINEAKLFIKTSEQQKLEETEG